VKPASFRFSRPTELDETLALLAEYGDEAVVMAGGQSLTPLLNLRMARPEVVIDVSRVSGLDELAAGSDALTVGATCRARRVELDPQVRSLLPVVPEALGYVGHPQIRNRSTLGGMVAFADPAAEIPAVLRACDGTVELRSADGRREVQAADFFTGVYQTARADDELVTAIRFTIPPSHRFVVTEYARRHGDFAVAGAVIGLDRAEGAIRGLRLGFFGVGSGPVRLEELERRFVGADFNGRVIDEIAGGVGDLLTPASDVHASAAYRRHVASVVTRRSLQALADKGVTHE
jgi:carbon-monoxide dehydrogenase medium subunit